MASAFFDLSASAVGLALVLPGFIWLRTQAAFVPRQRVSWSETLLEFAAYSIANYAFWMLLFPAEQPEAIEVWQLTALQIIGWLCVLFVGPFFGGAITGIARRKRWLPSLLAQLRLVPSIDTGHPDAWSKAFSNSDPQLAVVGLKNGERVTGAFGMGSDASIDPANRDLFLERCYSEDENGDLESESLSQGIYIPADEIRYVKFYRIEVSDSGAKDATDGSKSESIR